MAGTGGEGVTPSTTSSGFDTQPPEGFTGGGYGRGRHDPLPQGYGWAPPQAPLPEGWHIDPRTHQVLAPGMQPAGEPPSGLLPGYSWIAPGTPLPEGWHIDPETDVLVPPNDLAEHTPRPGSAGGAGWNIAGPTAGTPPPQRSEEPEAPWPQTGPQPRAE